jgi:hypothetical protein
MPWAGARGGDAGGLGPAGGVGIGDRAEDDLVEGLLQRLALEIAHHHRVVDGNAVALLDRRSGDGGPGLSVLGLQAQIGVGVDVLHFEHFTLQRRGGRTLSIGGECGGGDQQGGGRRDAVMGGQGSGWIRRRHG